MEKEEQEAITAFIAKKSRVIKNIEEKVGKDIDKSILEKENDIYIALLKGLCSGLTIALEIIGGNDV